MTERVILEILNTSLVVGIGIAVSVLLLSLGGVKYCARCRKIVWTFAACSLLVPFGMLTFPRVYTANIPVVVLKEGVYTTSTTATGKEVDPGTDQPASALVASHEKTQPAQDLPAGGTIDTEKIGTEKKAEITTADVLFGIWLCGCVFLTCYYAVGYQRMRRMIRRWGSVCEDERVKQIFSEVASEVRLKKMPDIWILPDQATGPCTTGLMRNVIILPDGVLRERDLKLVLKHEAIHCKNHDILWKLFFLSVNIIHWFNPLVWLLRSLVEQDMEIVCDEEVVRDASKEEKKEYGDVIMSWVEKSKFKRSAISTGYVREVKFLKRRFETIFNGGAQKKGVLLAGTACILILFAGCAVRVQNGGRVYSANDSGPIGGVESGNLYADNGMDNGWDREPNEAPATQGSEVGAEPVPMGTDTNVEPVPTVPTEPGAEADTDTEIVPTETAEDSMPDELREIKDTAETFAAAYFDGDKERLKHFLVSPYEGDMEVYESTGSIDDITVKGLPEPGGQELGAVVELSVEFRDHNFYADAFRYLTLELVKQEDGWKIQFYGLEG